MSDQGKQAVVVTGASTGIGRACARELHGAGFRVFGTVRKEEDMEALRQEGIEPVRMEVTDDARVHEAAGEVREQLGDDALVGLVNNAGMGVGGPLEFLPLERIRTQFEVNVTGQIAVTQAFLPLLRPSRGRIVFMSSLGGRVSQPFIGPYTASKHAIEALADSLRSELQPWGMHVALVEPGRTESEIWDKGEREADRVQREMGEEAGRLYGAIFDRMGEAIAENRQAAISAEHVARAVHKALTAGKPKTRYPVGKDTRAGLVANWLLPDRVLDGMVRRELGLPKEPPEAAESSPGAGSRAES